MTTDPKLETEERKTLKFQRLPDSRDGVVNIELRCMSKQSASSHKVDIQHSDLMVIQSLINVGDWVTHQYSLPYIVGWHALSSKQGVVDDMEHTNN